MRCVLYTLFVTVLSSLAFFVPFTSAQDQSQDPVRVSPQFYTVRVENDRVRVLEYRLKPGEKEAMHSHPAYVVHVLSDATVRTTLPSGTTAETTVKNGEIIWSEPASHAAENIGRTDLHLIIVELKGPGR
jgi:quercetin dioxygenase-like cupin family protein